MYASLLFSRAHADLFILYAICTVYLLYMYARRTFVVADHQPGLPEHLIFKGQVRSTTMLSAIERVGGKTSSGDQQGGRGKPDAALPKIFLGASHG